MMNAESNTEPLHVVPNDFPGRAVGSSQVIKMFRKEPKEGFSIEDRKGSFLFILHNNKRGLWSLESPAGLLIGVGNPFPIPDYLSYIQTFPAEVIAMLKDHLAKCESPGEALMFAVNNSFRVLPKDDGMSYLYFPDNTFFLLSDNIYNVLPAKVLVQNDNYWGYKISRWVRNQLDRINNKNGKGLVQSFHK
jgi:hypothetical protein